MLQLHVTINTSDLDAIQARLSGMDDIIADLCSSEIDEYAQRYVPVRTGFLKSTGGIFLMGNQWINYFSAGYSYFVEMGTRKMAAQSFLRITIPMVNWIENVAKAAREIGL